MAGLVDFGSWEIGIKPIEPPDLESKHLEPITPSPQLLT